MSILSIEVLRKEKKKKRKKGWKIYASPVSFEIENWTLAIGMVMARPLGKNVNDARHKSPRTL